MGRGFLIAYIDDHQAAEDQASDTASGFTIYPLVAQGRKADSLPKDREKSAKVSTQD